MLKSIHLKNLAIIKESETDLEGGLNIMTGETGSGKSLIAGAVNIGLGEKASKSVIRTGAEYALIELFFTSCDERVLSVLDSMDIERDGRNILITRKISKDSSVSKINGENVTLSSLKKLTSLLADVHGQHDHQSLLNPAKHMEILDDFAQAPVKKIKAALSSELSSYKALRAEFKKFDIDEESAQREISLLEYEINEIDSASLTPGEDERLEAEFQAMAGSRKTWENINRINSIFSDETDGVIQKTSRALKEATEAAKTDPLLLSYKNTLADIDSLLKDFGRDITHYISENTFDSERFAAVSARLDEINRLKARYGGQIPEILSYRSRCALRLSEYSNFENTKASLSEKMARSKAKINGLAKELSSERKKAAAVLEPLICENLKDLNFADCNFKISFDVAQKISHEGFDKVRFMISLNPGEPLKPLSDIASGGELSRIMLALKSALAGHDRIPTLIFDEIDTGISGNTAFKVSEKLKNLSRTRQIICITHLPQIASMADAHFHIEKEISDGSTISAIRRLDEEESVKELAGMISGSEITPAALKHARELKKQPLKL